MDAKIFTVAVIGEGNSGKTTWLKSITDGRPTTRFCLGKMRPPGVSDDIYRAACRAFSSELDLDRQVMTVLPLKTSWGEVALIFCDMLGRALSGESMRGIKNDSRADATVLVHDARRPVVRRECDFVVITHCDEFCPSYVEAGSSLVDARDPKSCLPGLTAMVRSLMASPPLPPFVLE